MANYGLMDQIAALKWVQQNIEQFGGDPAAVTLFGHRTGAACIHFLMESPAAVAGSSFLWSSAAVANSGLLQ
jgi:carboxylesterase type B